MHVQKPEVNTNSADRFSRVSFFTACRPYLLLTKPRIVLLSSFCAGIGMLLAPHSGREEVWLLMIMGLIGISLLSAAGFVLNCLIEQEIDGKMSRTVRRPLVQGAVSKNQAILFAFVLGTIGSAVLCFQVNLLTFWLTISTFLGYAFIYTVLLKPATPQNIVIGGASGAMPPLLGWATVTNQVSPESLILFLIIFVWTPPHFWALALQKVEEYKKAGLPMLPVTHGSEFTRLNVLLYTGLLTAVSFLPYVIRMSGIFYLLSAVFLDGVFIVYAWRLWKSYSDSLAKKTFDFSIFYLAFLFLSILIDHFLIRWI